MDGYLAIFQAALPVFLLAGLGVVFRQVRWLTPEADQSLLRIITLVLYPCLILDHTLTSEAVRQWDNLVLPPAVGFGTIVTGYLIAWLVAPLFGLRESVARRTFAFCAGIVNYGFLALPIIQLLYRRDETVAVLFVHNLGVEVAIWTVGIALISGQLLGPREAGRSAGGGWKQLVNGPIVAVVGGVVLNLTGVGEWVPPFARTTLHMLGQCSVPLSLIASGAVVADLLAGQRLWQGWRVPVGAALVRQLLVPLAILTAAWLLPASDDLTRVMIVQAAMPAGIFPIVLTRLHRGDTAVAVQVVLASSAVSLFTIPLAITFGQAWVLP